MLQDMLEMLKQKENAKTVKVHEAIAETARYELDAALQEQSAARVRLTGHLR